MISKFTGETKLGEVTDMPEGHAASQKDHYGLEK